MTEPTTLTLYTAHDDEEMGVQISTNLIPQVGQRVTYWVDYPSNHVDDVFTDEDDIVVVEGTVQRMHFDYRKMLGYGRITFHSYVSVFISPIRIKRRKDL